MPDNDNRQPFTPIGYREAETVRLYLKIINTIDKTDLSSPAELYDALEKIGRRCGIDISAGRAKTLAGSTAAKNALNALVISGLAIEENGRYKIAPGMEQRYYDQLYKIKYDADMARSAKRLAGFCKGAASSDVFKSLPVIGLVFDASDNIRDFAVDRLTAKFDETIGQYEGFSEADKRIRGVHAPEITRDMVSEAMQKETKGCRVSGLVSFMNGLQSFAGYTIVMARRDGIYEAEKHIQGKTGIFGRFFGRSEQVSKAVLGMLEGTDKLLKHVYDKSFADVDASNDMESGMLDYMKKEEGYKERARAFAFSMQSMNVFRCGTSANIPGWCRAMHMGKLDTAYSMLLLRSRMEKTIDGIILGEPKFNEDVAMLEFERLAKNGSVRELDAAVKKLEEGFVKEHKALVEQVASDREMEGLPPLSKRVHFNKIYDNPDFEAREDFKYAEMDAGTFRSKETSLENIYKEGKQAVIVHFKGAIAGLFRGEAKGLVGLLDRENRLDSLGDFRTDHAQDSDMNKENCYRLAEEGVNRAKASSLAKNEPDKSLRFCISSLAGKFLGMSYDAGFDPETKMYSFSDPLSGHGFILGSKDMQYQNSEMEIPEVRSFVRDVRDGMLVECFAGAGISERDTDILDKALERAKVLPLPPKMVPDPLLKKAVGLDGLRRQLEDLDYGDVLDPARREKVLADLRNGYAAEPVTEDEIYGFESKLADYEALRDTDPVLAACRLADGSFRREDGCIKGNLGKAQMTIHENGSVEVSGLKSLSRDEKSVYNDLACWIEDETDRSGGIALQGASGNCEKDPDLEG